MKCGARLAVSGPKTVERKVVTMLFCDLIGFTEMSESADPEDVDRLLREFSALVREVVTAHGGSLEKFIGDAAAAVFGVPVAHEDDPERAVRAALRILEGLPDIRPVGSEPVRARAGVNTGRALVRLDVDPQAGQGFLTGDAVNTAARLQAAAPPMGVVVGEATYALSAKQIEYESLGTATVKGKAEPVPMWLAMRPVSRTGLEFDAGPPGRFVDRTVELETLTGLLKETSRRFEPHFCLLVGEAGIGKSRLIFELARFVDRWPELVTWRQGSCASYGEVSPFGALAQIVKAQAGILESDGPADVELKLDEMLAESTEREWLRSRLRPLVGIDSWQASLEENLAAWRRFLEDLARERPTVLIFEDLHWADPSLVYFLQELVTVAADVPLLVVGAARPELLDVHPELDALAERVRVIELKGMSQEATSQLADGLLSASDAFAEMHDMVVRRSGGNPLYAEELARMLVEQAADGLLGDAGRTGDALPGSLQSLITARLDSLRPQHKALLADAAVVGPEFWLGAVARVSGLRPETAEAELLELTQRDLVRSVRVSVVEGDRQYAFRHAVLRDVAYDGLPRGVRAAKHAAVADWLQHDSGARVDEVADVLAHHRTLALELSQAAGDHELADAQLEPAVEALTLAGDHALPLDVTAAEARYAQAAALGATDSPQRPRLLTKWGKALMDAGRFDASLRAFEEGTALLEEAGDLHGLALAVIDYATALALVGDVDAAARLHRQTVQAMQGSGPSPERLALLSSWAQFCDEIADREAALAAAAEAVAMAADLGLDAPHDALVSRAHWRCSSGDPAGLEEYRRALERAKQQGRARAVGATYFNYAAFAAQFEGPAASLPLLREGLEFSTSRHDRAIAFSLRFGIAQHLCWVGEWRSALAEAEDLDPTLEEAGNWAELGYLRALEARLLTSSGRIDEAVPLADWLEPLGRGPGEASLRAEALLACAGVRAMMGDLPRARALLTDCLGQPGLPQAVHFSWFVPEAARITATIGELTLLVPLTDIAAVSGPLRPCVEPSVRALAAECAGDVAAAEPLYAAASAGWSSLGVPHELALSNLGRARCLLALGRRVPALLVLRQAEDLLRPLEARPALDEARRLLRTAGTADS
jgi:class 3 adenylate cyclase/tetratricopeptide (TPR) repeat protein